MSDGERTDMGKTIGHFENYYDFEEVLDRVQFACDVAFQSVAEGRLSTAEAASFVATAIKLAKEKIGHIELIDVHNG